MSDPKDKSDDFTSLFEMADFDHQDDQETEDYFAKKAIEDKDSNDESYDDDNSDEKTQTVIDTSFITDEVTESDIEGVKESHEDDSFDDFSNFDEFESNKEMTQVNFNPQELLASEENNEDESSFFDEDVDETNDQSQSNEFDDISKNKDADSTEINEVSEEPDSEPETNLETEQKKQDIPVASFDNLNKTATKITYTQQYENFEDIQRFANTSHYSTIKSQGNPSFSIIISDIKYKEDSLKIFTILNEYGFINSSNKEIIQKSLDRGSAIISRVSEFAAYHLYHQVHLLDIKLQIGPSDLIYTSSASNHDQTGAVSSQNLLQNKEDSKKIKNEILSSILLSTSSEIIGYSIKDFFGTCRQSLEFQAFPKIQEEDSIQKVEKIETRDAFKNAHKQVEAELKKQIQSKGGNAGVDMKVEIIPLFQEEHQTYTYQVVLNCHAVWIDKN